jgi:putative FmdB family regulatory protein
MPTYEYVCKSCGHLFDIVQSMRDDPLTECPECGGELRKVFAPPAIAFKGSGFYATDQRKKTSEAPERSGDKPADTSTGEKGGKGGEGGKDAKKKSDAASTDAGGKQGSTSSTDGGGSTGSATGASPAPSTGSNGKGTGS